MQSFSKTKAVPDNVSLIGTVKSASLVMKDLSDYFEVLNNCQYRGLEILGKNIESKAIIQV